MFIRIIQLFFSLSLLIVLHELGHFLCAKFFKTRVEKFYLFFNPWFSLYKKKIGETIYGIGWLPLGGYVKISGMIDESMDTKQLDSPPKPYEFRSKPAWQRLIIMLGGVTVNFIVAIIIYSFVLMIYGEKKINLESFKDGIWVTNSSMKELGFQDGDKILNINNKKIVSYLEAQEHILYSDSVLVQRNDKRYTIYFDETFIKSLLESKQKGLLFYPRIPTVISEVIDNSYADKYGLKAKDEIIFINNKEVKYFDQFQKAIKQYKNKEVILTLKRGENLKKIKIMVDKDGKLGFQNYIPSLYELNQNNQIEYLTKTYNFFSSIPAGVALSINKLASYYNQFKIVLNPKTEAYKSVGGIATFSKLFGETWSWQNFLTQTAFISIILAFMNLLPIPGLDGGHVFFLLIEIITKNKINQKIQEYAQMLGIIILILIFIYANTDFLRW